MPRAFAHSVRSSDCNENGLIHLFQMLSWCLKQVPQGHESTLPPENTTMDYKTGRQKRMIAFMRMLTEDIAELVHDAPQLMCSGAWRLSAML